MVLDLPELMWDNYSTMSQEDPTEKKTIFNCVSTVSIQVSQMKKKKNVMDSWSDDSTEVWAAWPNTVRTMAPFMGYSGVICNVSLSGAYWILGQK